MNNAAKHALLGIANKNYMEMVEKRKKEMEKEREEIEKLKKELNKGEENEIE